MAQLVLMISTRPLTRGNNMPNFINGEIYLITGIILGILMFFAVLVMKMKSKLSQYKHNVWINLGDHPGRYYNEALILHYWRKGMSPAVCAKRLINIQKGMSGRRRSKKYI